MHAKRDRRALVSVISQSSSRGELSSNMSDLGEADGNGRKSVSVEERKLKKNIDQAENDKWETDAQLKRVEEQLNLANAEKDELAEEVEKLKHIN
ncbi:hypothetical protein CF319_g8999 [Tilletia indica]|nr:hypothetical protein CF319_g8999 [Tilletia indica]